jgi:hypothetical protein
MGYGGEREIRFWVEGFKGSKVKGSDVGRFWFGC